MNFKRINSTSSSDAPNIESNDSTREQLPLKDIRVLDLTRVLAGPFCTMILCNLGAEVIKVEASNGDDARQFGPFIDNISEKSAYFYSINCGKKSVVLNLKTDVGKRLLCQLIKKVDVLVENYRPGTMERLGFAENDIKKLNPDIIYATATGFGYSGPDSKNAAYDSIIQALSGLIAITGTEQGEVVRVGTSISDIVTGLYTAIGICAALFRREKNALGARIDIAMLDSTVSVLENALARYQVTGQSPRPLGTRHPSITPFESFRTSDSALMIAAGNDSLFEGVCDVIEIQELKDDARFRTNLLRTENRDALYRIIQNRLLQKTTADWLEAFNARNIPCAKINSIEELFKSPQLAARQMLVPVESEKEFMVTGNPIKINGVSDSIVARRPPRQGEHTVEILSGLLGYSSDEVDDFMERMRTS